MSTRYFAPSLFAFLRELAANNTREWFAEHSTDYEKQVRGPVRAFLADAQVVLSGLSDSLAAAGVIRIRRDARYSADPYKTYTGLYIRHVDGDGSRSPGIYLRLEPANCFVRVGVWRPDAATADAIRCLIDEQPGGWESAVSALGDRTVLDGESLKRLPNGFPPDHPLSADLRRREFLATTRLTQASVTSSGFLDEFSEIVWRSEPLMRFVCEATGLAF